MITCMYYPVSNPPIVARAFFMNVDKKIIKHFSDSNLSGFEGTKYCNFERAKSFFGNMFYYFFIQVHKR